MTADPKPTEREGHPAQDWWRGQPESYRSFHWPSSPQALNDAWDAALSCTPTPPAPQPEAANGREALIEILFSQGRHGLGRDTCNVLADAILAAGFSLRPKGNEKVCTAADDHDAKDAVMGVLCGEGEVTTETAADLLGALKRERETIRQLRALLGQQTLTGYEIARGSALAARKEEVEG